MKQFCIFTFYFCLEFGGGVSESNQPEFALTNSQTVLKTAPVTGQDAPPARACYKTKHFNKKLSSLFSILAVSKACLTAKNRRDILISFESRQFLY